MTPQERETDIAARKRQAMTENGKQAQHKIWVRDGWAYRDVWEVPIERLLLNVDNKRFSSERELVEHKLGRPLDPANNHDDELSIISILCDASLDVDVEKGLAVGTPSKDFLALREDWQNRGQAEPLWIRPDGTVRNGNRRLAMLKRQRSAGADINWVDAIILTVDDVDESELFRMEQREQLTENFKKRYQDVNALLALKDAAELEDIDWEDADSIASVASRLKHYAGRDDAGYASKQLYAIRALDNYLNYINAPGRYSLAARQVEVFREVGLCMSTYEDEPDEQFELLQAAYAFVQAGSKYGEIRQLRKLFGSDRNQFDDMMRRILKIEEDSGWDPEISRSDVGYPELSDATAPEAEDPDDDADLGGLIGLEDYPKHDVGQVITGALDRFTASSLDVQRQLDQALARLEVVDLTVLGQLQGEAQDGAREVVTSIQMWTAHALQSLE